MTTKSRAVASFIGLAIGDALGSAVEFMNPGEFKPITTYRRSPVWNTPAGYWTDDTSMAICLAESILYRNTVDPVDLLQRFARWYLEGENSSMGVCFDIGNTTRINIEQFLSKGVTQAPDVPHQSGNGGIMRLAPVAIRWWHNTDWAQHMAQVQSACTHGSAECDRCATDLVTLLTQAIQGSPVKQQLTQAHMLTPESQIENTGRAISTLNAAKWCVATTHSFESAVLKAVNLGGDADTIGAVTGQIAGACYGVEQIPSEWLSQLHDVDRLTDMAEQLYWASQSNS